MQFQDNEIVGQEAAEGREPLALGDFRKFVTTIMHFRYISAKI